MDSSKLFRHECTNCGNVVFSDEHYLSECGECDDKYAAMRHTPTPEHDKAVGEEPPDSLACPECGLKMAATATEDGKDWKCRSGGGGCGYAGWRWKEGEEAGIPAPEDLSGDEASRQDAWSRYQRYQAGHYEY